MFVRLNHRFGLSFGESQFALWSSVRVRSSSIKFRPARCPIEERVCRLCIIRLQFAIKYSRVDREKDLKFCVCLLFSVSLTDPHLSISSPFHARSVFNSKSDFVNDPCVHSILLVKAIVFI